eukprot:13717499-Alexandrium_andersonii.AAC.1
MPPPGKAVADVAVERRVWRAAVARRGRARRAPGDGPRGEGCPLGGGAHRSHCGPRPRAPDSPPG